MSAALRERMAQSRAKLPATATPSTPAPVPTPPAASVDDLIDKMAASKPGKKRIATDDVMQRMLDEYLMHTEEAKSHKTMADQCRDQIVAQARPLFYDACAKAGKSLSSIAIGKGTLTVTNNYSAIPMTEKNNLLEAFGDDYGTYFREDVDLSLNKDSANDPSVRKHLLDVLGAEFFTLHFDPKKQIRVNEALHVGINTDPQVRAIAQPLVDKLIIKPYSPSIKLK